MSITQSDVNKRFGKGNPKTVCSIGQLYSLLVHTDFFEIQTSLEQWKTHFWETTGIEPNIWTTVHDSIAKYFAIPKTLAPSPSELLFSVQTHFASLLQKVIQKHSVSTPLPEMQIYNWVQKIGAQSWTKTFQEIECEIDKTSFCDLAQTDIFGALYQQFFPGAVRKRLGEFYTPDWLAELLLQTAGFDPLEHSRILDPTCGSGVFLLAAMRVMRAKHIPDEKMISRLTGFDLNPLAILMAKANFAVALRNSVSLTCRDSLTKKSIQEVPEPVFDLLIGNPPWLQWDKLPANYREATKELWSRYGLFNLSGSEARYGGAKKELALLMIMATADQFLKNDGKLAMVLPQSVFQTKKAGDGFRHFGDLPTSLAAPLKVLRVDDFSQFRVFADVTVNAATILLQKNRRTTYPVPYYCWKSRKENERCDAIPVDQSHVGSPWYIVSPKRHQKISLRPSEYRAMLGANTAGANGVFWVELLQATPTTSVVRNLVTSSRQKILQMEVEVESELLYPLLRWKDVDCFSATPSAWIIMTQDPEKRRGIEEKLFHTKYPKTQKYLEQFEELLKNRAAHKKYHHDVPFYSMYNVARDTFAKIKVVWRRMETRIRAAVVGEMSHALLGQRPMIPQETCSMVAVSTHEEANYLAVILNSQAVHQLVTSFSPQGGKGFGSPGMLEYLPIPHFDPTSSLHLSLSQTTQRIPFSHQTEQDVEHLLSSERVS